MGTLYVDTGGNAANSGCTDSASPLLTGTAATVAGSVVSLDGSPDLSGLITSGPTQSSIRLADATNSNQKIFWITAVDNGAKTVTVSVAPTGVTSSAWRIGGQLVYASADLEGALRGGDEVVFNNSPASKSGAAFFTQRAAGATNTGLVKLRGKTGVRPVLTITDTNFVVNGAALGNLALENLEIVQQGASGNVLSGLSNGVVRNVKISDGGGIGVNGIGNGTVLLCEITGVGGDGINTLTNGSIFWNYIHDISGDGFESATTSTAGAIYPVIGNIIESCAGRGLFWSGALGSALGYFPWIAFNTVYGNGNSGLEVTDADFFCCLFNNIFSENGNAAGEYNVELADERGVIHGYNIFHHSGGGGAGNLSGLTPGDGEDTADPLMIEPSAGDFRLRPNSPARWTGAPRPFLGGDYPVPNMGAMQSTFFHAIPGLHPIASGITGFG